MKLKLDENLPAEGAAVLREAGFDAVTVLEPRLGGAADDRLLKICTAEGSGVG